MADNEQSYESELMKLIDNDDLEAEMQPGQCRTLQARLLKYLKLNGREAVWRGQNLKCEMPSGAKICIFSTPRNPGGFLYNKNYYYGAVLFPYRERDRVRYISEHSAKHLYHLLGEQIKEDIEKLN